MQKFVWKMHVRYCFRFAFLINLALYNFPCHLHYHLLRKKHSFHFQPFCKCKFLWNQFLKTRNSTFLLLTCEKIAFSLRKASDMNIEWRTKYLLVKSSDTALVFNCAQINKLLCPWSLMVCYFAHFYSLSPTLAESHNINFASHASEK